MIFLGGLLSSVGGLVISTFLQTPVNAQNVASAIEATKKLDAKVDDLDRRTVIEETKGDQYTKDITDLKNSVKEMNANWSEIRGVLSGQVVPALNKLNK